MFLENVSSETLNDVGEENSCNWSMMWLSDVSSSRRRTWEKGAADGKEFRRLLRFLALCARKSVSWCRDRYRGWEESGTVGCLSCLSLCDSKTHSQSADRLFGFLHPYQVDRCWGRERIQSHKRGTISAGVLCRGRDVVVCLLSHSLPRMTGTPFWVIGGTLEVIFSHDVISVAYKYWASAMRFVCHVSCVMTLQESYSGEFLYISIYFIHTDSQNKTLTLAYYIHIN